MIAAAMAFTFETSIIATSETATGEDNHSHQTCAIPLADIRNSFVTRPARDGPLAYADGALDHIFRSVLPVEHGIVVGVLTRVVRVEAILIGKLAIEGLDPYRGTEPDVPGRPPRPPSIA
jgi:hypothetical protein